jgi:hypothetical protein
LDFGSFILSRCPQLNPVEKVLPFLSQANFRSKPGLG